VMKPSITDVLCFHAKIKKLDSNNHLNLLQSVDDH